MAESDSEVHRPDIEQEVSKSESPKTTPARGKSIGRRLLLQFFAGATSTALLGTVAGVAENRFGFISRLLQPDVENIPREVPPQLRGMEIPYTNDHYRKPVDVLQQAMDEYTKEGGRPFYTPPSYYLTTGEAVRSLIASGFDTNFAANDKPYDAAIDFSTMTIDHLDFLYDADPGTSSKEDIEQRLRGQSNINEPLNAEYQLGPTKKDLIVAQTYTGNFDRTKRYMDQIRGSERLSTSELFKYYLRNNYGDIVQSLWDSTLFLKFAARTDLAKAADIQNWQIDTETSLSNASRQGAELLSSMFYDEFSSEIPLEWLLTAVSPHDTVLNDGGRDINTQWKDFMPVNRAGTPYHVYNVAALSAMIDPQLVEEKTILYYNNSFIKQQGRVKARADFEAAHEARDMRGLFERYRK